MKKASKTRLKSTRILLVDGDSHTRNSRAMMLSTHGYGVECASNLAESIKQCQRQSPDLILVALSEKPSETFELAQSVREANPKLQVAVLLHEQQHLCEVSIDGKSHATRQDPEGMIERIEQLLA